MWSAIEDHVRKKIFLVNLTSFCTRDSDANPNLVVVDQDQTGLIKLLEKQGLDVIPLKLRHAKMLGGGFHCVTLDIRRTGTLQRYFD